MHTFFYALCFFFAGISHSSPIANNNINQLKSANFLKNESSKSIVSSIKVFPDEIFEENYFRYEGKVGDKDIVAILCIEASVVWGNYFYNHIGSPISIDGIKMDNDSVYLNEYCLPCDALGSFKGILLKNGNIRGEWGSENGKRKTPFILFRKKISGLSNQSEHFSLKNCEMTEGIDTLNYKNLDSNCSVLHASILTLNTSFPYIGDKINSIMVSKFNAMIKAEITSGDENFSNFTSFMESFKQKKIVEDPASYEFYLDSYISYMDEHIICLGISCWQNASDYAYPWDSSEEFVFDLKTGNLVTLSSIMKPNYKTSLNNIGLKAMQKFISHPSLESKDFILSENFTVNPFGLIFHYRRGEIGSSYADIPFEFFIPFGDIKHLLKSGTILTNYLKF